MRASRVASAVRFLERHPFKAAIASLVMAALLMRLTLIIIVSEASFFDFLQGLVRYGLAIAGFFSALAFVKLSGYFLLRLLGMKSEFLERWYNDLKKKLGS
jgi:hypothetical protein